MTATKKKPAEPPKLSMAQRVKLAVDANREQNAAEKARRPARVHGLDERPAAPTEAAAIQAASDERRRKVAEGRERRRAAQAERRKPRLAAVAQLYPLLHSHRERWTVVAPKDDRVVPISRDFAENEDILNTRAVQAIAAPPPAIARRHEARPAAWQPADIIERLASVNVTLELAPDGRLAASGPGGHMDPAVAAIIAGHYSVLVAHLGGTPVSCSWCEEPPIVTVVGGALACEQHLLER